MARPKAKKLATVTEIDTKPEIIELPVIQERRVSVPIKGLSPLVVHNWDEKSIIQMLDKQMGKARVAKPHKDPEACFEAAKYKDSSGKDCLRSEFFKNAFVSAARFVEGVTMTAMKMSLFVEGDELGNLPLEYEKVENCRKMVRNDSGVADIRFRPMYHHWSTELVVRYYAADLSLSQVVLLIRQAGLRVGICEARPEKSALCWGRFDIDFAALEGRRITSESVAA